MCEISWSLKLEALFLIVSMISWELEFIPVKRFTGPATWWYVLFLHRATVQQTKDYLIPYSIHNHQRYSE